MQVAARKPAASEQRLNILIGILVLACLIVAMLGSRILLGAMQDVEAELTSMSAGLAETQEGMVEVKASMSKLESTTGIMRASDRQIVRTGEYLAQQQQYSATLMKNNDRLSASVDTIIANTLDLNAISAEINAATEGFEAPVDELGPTLNRIKRLQGDATAVVPQLQGAIGSMNAQLGYVIRLLNYMSVPPNGEPMTVLVTPDENILPRIPGVEVKAEPLTVFERKKWPIYTGP